MSVIADKNVWNYQKYKLCFKVIVVLVTLGVLDFHELFKEHSEKKKKKFQLEVQ